MMLSLRKTMTIWPAWEAAGSHRDGRWTFTTGLALDDAEIADVQLRGTALQGHPNREVVLQLEAVVDHKSLPIARADYRPFRSHRNPWTTRHSAATIDAGVTHIHRFADNVRAASLEGLHANLPNAQAMDPPPSSARSFFSSVALEFGIPDLARIDPPIWQGGFAV